MCKPSLRTLFWAGSLFALSLVSILAEWDDGSFWAVFCAFVAMGSIHGRRHARSC